MQPAGSGTGTNGSPAVPPAPEAPGSGVDNLVRGPELRKGNEPTFYERYGSDGFTLDSSLGFSDFLDKTLNAVAGALWAVVVWVVSTAIKLFQWAFSMDLSASFGDAVTAIVAALRDSLYAPFLWAAVILAGAWALWHGLLRRRGMLATEGMVWTVVALVAGTLFLTKPASVIGTADFLSTGLGRGILAAVSVADPKKGPADGITAKPTFSDDAADTQLRVSADRIWRTFVYTPWLVLEFGGVESGQKFGERLLQAKTWTGQETVDAYKAGVTGDPRGMQAITEVKERQYNQMAAEIQAMPNTGAWFRGEKAIDRIGVATLALVAALLAGGLLLLLSGGVFVVQLAFLVLVVLAPIFLLLGIQPGAGRVLATRWVEVLTGLLVKRVAYAALLAVVLVVSGILLDATYPMGWAVAMVLQVLVMGAALFYRRPFAFIFGGNSSVRPGAGDAAAPASASGRSERRSDRGSPAPGTHWAPGAPLRTSMRPGRREQPAPRTGQGTEPAAQPSLPSGPPPGGEVPGASAERALPLAGRIRQRVVRGRGPQGGGGGNGVAGQDKPALRTAGGRGQ